MILLLDRELISSMLSQINLFVVPLDHKTDYINKPHFESNTIKKNENTVARF